MTGLLGTTDAATGTLAYYGGGMGAQTPLIVSILQLVVIVGVYVWLALALTALLRKAGQPAWKAWVPVVNAWTLFTLGGMAGWWAVVLAVGGLLAGVGSVVVAALFAGAALGAAGGGEADAAGAAVIGAVLVPAIIWLVYGVGALILQIRMLLGVNRGFGLGGGYTVLGVLLLPVWASVVGWGSARWLGLPPKIAQPTLTTPPPPPAASPFTLGTVSATHDAMPAAPAAGPSSSFPGTVADHSTVAAVPPPPPPAGGNPWAPPPPPGAAPAPTPATAPAAPVPMRAPAPASAPAAPVAAAAPVAPAAPVVAAAPVAASPVPAAWAAGTVPAAAPAEGAAEADDLDERTVLAARRQGGWSLLLPGGTSVTLRGDTAVLGRNPVAAGTHAGAQVIPVDDATRTVSKTHAALQRRGDGWVVTDLSSTNGVFLEDEREVAGSAEVSGVFFLGDARLELRADA